MGKTVTKSHTATKAKKSKSGPKRGLSAYMFFSQSNREQIKNENPNATFGELGKLLGARWKELSDSEKKPYLDKAAADKKRYDEEMANYKK